jgi:hypothetical protein
MIIFYGCWRRRFFEIGESRLRVRLYLHEGLDLEAAIAYWSALTRFRRRSSGGPIAPFRTLRSEAPNMCMAA